MGQDSAPEEPNPKQGSKLSRMTSELMWVIWISIAAFFLSDELVRFHDVKIGIYVACIASALALFAIYRYLQIRKLYPKGGESWFTLAALIVAGVALFVKVVLAVML